MCQYDRSTTVGTSLEQAAATHGAGILEHQLQIARRDGALSLAGEVDWSNEMVLLSAVRTATGTAAERLWIDLRRMAFMSVGGCRALMVGAQQFRDGGGHLALVAPQSIVQRVLRPVGLDALMNVEIVGSAP